MLCINDCWFWWTLVCIILDYSLFKTEFVWYIELGDAVWEGFEHRNGYRIQAIIYVYNLIDLKIIYHQGCADEVAHDGQ